MGVDYFPCDRCASAICDCGDWIHCNDECGRRWCEIDCARADGYVSDPESTDDESCAFCRNETIEDAELIEYLLTRLKTTRENAVRRCIKAREKANDADSD